MEQNHRGIKSRYKVMKGFQDSWCAMIFYTVFEEIRQFFRMIPSGAQANKTQANKRKCFASRFQEFEEMVGITA